MTDVPQRLWGERAEIERKTAAMEIIFLAPLWPARADLGSEGRALFDVLIDTAKPYALLIADGRFEEALVLAARWSALVNGLIDSTRIVGDEPSERLLRVYRYYTGQVGDLSQIQLSKASSRICNTPSPKNVALSKSRFS